MLLRPSLVLCVLVLLADGVGPVHALFCLEYARCFYRRSDDDGPTWSQPVEITDAFERFRGDYDWKVLATGPAHGIQLRSGRLVVPVWLSTGTGGHAYRPSVTATIVSDDAGVTWKRGSIPVPNTPEWINPNETVVVELADGRGRARSVPRARGPRPQARLPARCCPRAAVDGRSSSPEHPRVFAGGTG